MGNSDSIGDGFAFIRLFVPNLNEFSCFSAATVIVRHTFSVTDILKNLWLQNLNFSGPNKPIISYLTSNALFLYSVKGEHFHLHLEPLEITSRSHRSLSLALTTQK